MVHTWQKSPVETIEAEGPAAILQMISTKLKRFKNKAD